jgi:hypothetical protein
LTRSATTRVGGFVALGGAVALGGIVALGWATLGAGAVYGTNSMGTAVATSVSFTVDVRAEIPAPNKVRMHLLVRGEMDFAHHTLAAAVTVPDASPRSSASNAEIMPAGGRMKLNLEWVDDHAYVAVPSSLSVPAGDAQSLSLPVSPSTDKEVDTALAQSAVALSYARILLKELTADQTVHPLGWRTFDGISATGTQVGLTLGQLLKLVPELSPAMTGVATTLANEIIPATVWVDHRGRLVEVTMAATKGNPASITGMVRFSHYDAPDKVTAPPATTVRPIPPALRQILGGLNFF